MLVPHTSDAPRSISVTERTLRRVAWVAGVAGLGVVLVFAALLLRVRESNRALAAAWQSGDHDVDSLQARLDSLRGRIAGIQSQEQRIRASVGVTPTESPSFWSRVLRDAAASKAPSDQQRTLSVVRDSLRREIRAVSRTTDSLVVRAVDANSRAQRMADSLTAPSARRP